MIPLRVHLAIFAQPSRNPEFSHSKPKNSRLVLSRRHLATLNINGFSHSGEMRTPAIGASVLADISMMIEFP
jgi:hypothetical protein